MRVSNAKLLKRLLLDERMTSDEFKVAVMIMSYRNEDTLCCIPLQSTLARDLKRDRKDVSRLISRLRKKGVLSSILVESRGGERVCWRNQYYFTADILDAEKLVENQWFLGDREAFGCARLKLALRKGVTHPKVGRCVPITKNVMRAVAAEKGPQN